jgi:hypothetical protein
MTSRRVLPNRKTPKLTNTLVKYNRGFPVNPAISPFLAFPPLKMKAKTFSAKPGGRNLGDGIITSKACGGRPMNVSDSSKGTFCLAEEEEERFDEGGEGEPGWEVVRLAIDEIGEGDVGREMLTVCDGEIKLVIWPIRNQGSSW